MARGRQGRRPVAAALAGLVTVLTILLGGPAAAQTARPTTDSAAPTPTAPIPGGPPQGHAPNGSTVGGEQLDTRGVVVANGAPPLPDGLAAAGWLVPDAGTGAAPPGPHPPRPAAPPRRPVPARCSLPAIRTAGTTRPAR